MSIQILEERKNTLQGEIEKYQSIIKLKQSQIESINQEISLLSGETPKIEEVNDDYSEYEIEVEDDITKDLEIIDETVEVFERLTQNCNINSKSDILKVLKEIPVVIHYQKKSTDEVVERKVTLNLEFAREYTGDNSLQLFTDKVKKHMFKDENKNKVFLFDLEGQQMKFFLIDNIVDIKPFS